MKDGSSPRKPNATQLPLTFTATHNFQDRSLANIVERASSTDSTGLVMGEAQRLMDESNEETLRAFDESGNTIRERPVHNPSTDLGAAQKPRQRALPTPPDTPPSIKVPRDRSSQLQQQRRASAGILTKSNSPEQTAGLFKNQGRFGGKRCLSETDSIARALKTSKRSSTRSSSTVPETPETAAVDGTTPTAVVLADESTQTEDHLVPHTFSPDSPATPTTPDNTSRLQKSPAKRTLQARDVDEKIRKYLSGGSDSNSTSDGYVYVAVAIGDNRPNQVKIGCALYVNERMRDSDYCKVPYQSEYHQDFAFRNYRLVESLVHKELEPFRRFWWCEECKRKHGEWFEVDKETAEKTVKHWTDLALRDPWNSDNELKLFWKQRLETQKGPAKEEKNEDHALRHARWLKFANPSKLDTLKHYWSVCWLYISQCKSDLWRLWALLLALSLLIRPGTLVSLMLGVSTCIFAVMSLNYEFKSTPK